MKGSKKMAEKLEEITFENTIKEGNEVLVDGDKCRVTLVDHKLPNSQNGGSYRVLFQPLDGSLEKQFHVSYEESRDWFILYQNGKK